MAERLTDLGLITPTSWGSNAATNAANSRLLFADNTDEADLQLKLETLSVLHSIRQLLFIMLVVVPALLVGATAILLAIRQG
jgi:hypothetical protein